MPQQGTGDSDQCLYMKQKGNITVAVFSSALGAAEINKEHMTSVHSVVLSYGKWPQF